MRCLPVKIVSVLFGSALLLGASAADAREFRTLYQFAGSTDGDKSVDRLLLDSSGNLYGVTTANSDVLGTVFVLSPGGTETVLHAFQFVPSQASVPVGGVVMDTAGNLYGEAAQGGEFLCPDISVANPDCGSLYKLATDGTLTTIYNFQGGDDGGGPGGGLLIDTAGSLYGMTKYGGTQTACTGGCGTVFKITPDGTKTVLYNFAGKSDGARPTGALVADSQNNLYGMTSQGGQGLGTIFKIAPDGSETQLHAFNGTDGNQPSSGLTIDPAGNLYGSTATGGNSGSQYGEVFKLTPDGTLTALHTFSNTGGDGVYPEGSLAMDGNGNLYGATAQGGKGCRSYGCGTVFEITKDGTYSQLSQFKGSAAHNPLGGVVIDGNGTVYGSALDPGKNPLGLGLLFAVQKKK